MLHLDYFKKIITIDNVDCLEYAFKQLRYSISRVNRKWFIVNRFYFMLSRTILQYLFSAVKQSVLLETVFFTFKLLEKEKQTIKNLAVKKRFPQFLLSMYVLCIYICVFVCLLAVYRRHRLTQEAEILTQIPICEQLKMVSFTFFNFCLFSELFPFFIFYYFLYFRAASRPIMKINTPN